MYGKPTLVRFGTFRQLTQIGFNTVSDGCTIAGIGNAVGNEEPPNPAFCGATTS
jgi:hypothetical protein